MTQIYFEMNDGEIIRAVGSVDDIDVRFRTVMSGHPDGWSPWDGGRMEVMSIELADGTILHGPDASVFLGDEIGDVETDLYESWADAVEEMSD